MHSTQLYRTIHTPTTNHQHYYTKHIKETLRQQIVHVLVVHFSVTIEKKNSQIAFYFFEMHLLMEIAFEMPYFHNNYIL